MSSEPTPDYHYTLSVLSRAVDALATGRGTLRPRLVSAMTSLMPLNEDDFPASLKERFRKLEYECNKGGSKEIHQILYGRVYIGLSGTLLGTIMHMRLKKLDEMARLLVSLESELRAELYDSESLQSKRGSDVN